MNNRTLACLLFFVLLVCSVMTTGDVAYGQADSFILEGTVREATGRAVGVGFIVDAVNQRVPTGWLNNLNLGQETRADGTYTASFIDIFGGRITNVGDEIRITVKDPAGKVVGRKTYIVTQAAIDNFGEKGVDVLLSGILVEPNPTAIPADGTSTSTIKVTVQDQNGSLVTNDTLTITAETGKGKVGTITNNRDGTYTATYTAPSLLLTAPTTDILTVHSNTLNESIQTTVTLQVVPTVVTVSVVPSIFSADGAATGTVQVTVKRGTSVADETVQLALTRSDGVADKGTVSSVTNNGDGTYTATYTPAKSVGKITLIATATKANVSSSPATITINAGPAAKIVLTATPETVSSEQTSLIAATVTDAAGNRVGGLTLSATTAAGGTATPFTEDATNFGRYTATYKAPKVDAAAPETVTVTIAGSNVSARQILNLTPVPPKAVRILVVTGTVLKKSSTLPVAGVDVTVAINGQPSPTEKTSDNGVYSTTIFDPLGAAARTGDLISIIVKDTQGAERGKVEFALTNEDLGETDSATVKRDVPTNIGSTSSALAVSGTVFLEDGLSSVGAGLGITVANDSRGISEKGFTEADGTYNVTFFNPLAVVAETDDKLTVTVTDTDGQTFSMTHTLTTAEVEAGQLKLDVKTNFLARERQIFNVVGTVRFRDGDTPVPGGLQVLVKINAAETLDTTEADGTYQVSFVDVLAAGIIAQTGDVVNVEVTALDQNRVVGTAKHTLSTAEIKARLASVNVTTDLQAPLATTNIFIVEGVILNKDGSPAEAGLNVTVTVGGRTESIVSTTGGNYSVTFFDPLGIVAESEDAVEIRVTRPATGELALFTGVASTKQIRAQRATINVKFPTEVITVDTPAPLKLDAKGEAAINLTATVKDTLGRPIQTTTVTARLVGIGSVTSPAKNNGDGTYTVTYSVSKKFGTATVTLTTAGGAEAKVELTIDDDLPPIVVATANPPAVEVNVPVTFDGSASTDNVAIASYHWDFGDGSTADTAKAEHRYDTVDVFSATLTVKDTAGNEASQTIKVTVGPLRLGGLSLNTKHYRDFVDRTIARAIAETDVGRLLGGEQLMAFIRDSPSTQADLLKLINSFIPAGLFPAQLTIRPDLPLIFDQSQNMDLENFGNGIMPSPLADLLPALNQREGGLPRMLVGDKLDLYLVVPRPGAERVTFTLSGPQGRTVEAKPISGPLSHTFQLEEEQAILFLPSWVPGLNDKVFSSVTLMYATNDLPQPGEFTPAAPTDRLVFSQTSLQPRSVGNKFVWETTIDLEPGKIYYYCYEVELAHPVTVNVPGVVSDYTFSKWAIPDPRNLQLEDRGIIARLLTKEFQLAIKPVLDPVVLAISQGKPIPAINLTAQKQQELLNIITVEAQKIAQDIVSTMDPMVTSLFTVPALSDSQSLWAATFDFNANADGAYQLDVQALAADGKIIDEIKGKKFTVDRTAPEADVTIATGANSAIYRRESDGAYVATALPSKPGSPAEVPEATLRITGIPKGNQADLLGYLYQMIKYEADPTKQALNIWLPLLVANPGEGLGTGVANQLAGLLPPEQIKILTDLLNVAPVTFAPPHQLDMLLRGKDNKPALIVGEYGIRAVGVDNILNIGSDTPPVRLAVVPPDADTAKVTFVVLGDYNGDGDTTDPFESGPANEETTIFSNTTDVKLTVEMTNRTAHPLVSIVVQFKSAAADAQWQDITTLGADKLAGAKAGSKFEVDWKIADFDALTKAGDRVMVRAVATNKLTISDPTPSIGTLKLDKGVIPVEPSVVALELITGDPSPDSGGPRGNITVNAFTQTRTAPETKAVRFEVRRRKDTGAWKSIGEATQSSAVEGPQIAIVEDIIKTIVGGASSAPIAQSYRKWSLTYDTTKLDDTITKDSPAARDATKDDNPWVVRAVAIDVNNKAYEPAAAVKKEFSLDNVDDVPPLTGTKIITVADTAGEIQGVDGIFTVGGGVVADVPKPTLTLTARPVAKPATFSQINLLVNVRHPDGSLGDAVDIGKINFEASGDVYIATVDLSKLENGKYLFQALAIDKAGNREERDVSLATSVDVENFVPPPGFGDALAGPEVAVTKQFTFTLEGISGVTEKEIDVLINGESARKLGLFSIVTEGPNTFKVTIDTSTLPDGVYTLQGVVTKRNGSAKFKLPSIKVDNTPPTITIVSPLAGSEVSALPTIHATYNDGTGVGIQPSDSSVVLALFRLVPPNETSVQVNQSQVQKNETTLVYTRGELLLGGAYRVTVTVKDTLGNTSTKSTEFTVVGTLPAVSILSPLSGQILDNAQPLISAIFTGAGLVNVTAFSIDGTAISVTPQMIEGNRLSYTPAPPLADGPHTVSIQVIDGAGKSAQASVTFTVKTKDTTPPVITQVSPQGIVRSSTATVLVIAFDEQSGVASVTISVDGATPVKGATREVTGLSAGRHTVDVVVTNGAGLETKFNWSFTVEIEVDKTPPVISAAAPQGVIKSSSATLSAVVTDEQSALTGVTIALDGGTAQAVPLADIQSGKVSRNVTGLTSGTHTVTIVATSAGGSTTHTWTFTVELDTTPPVISAVAPQGVIKVADTTISAVVTDEQSAVTSVTITLDGIAVPASGAVTGLKAGTHTVIVRATSAGGTSTHTWTFTVELDTTPPVISEVAPQGVIRTASATLSAVVTDEQSAITAVTIALDGGAAQAVPLANIQGGRVSRPAPGLTSDTHTVTIVATSAGGSTTHTWTFTVELDETPPAITTTSPHGIVRVEKPTISAAASDDLSGVDTIQITVTDSKNAKVAGRTTASSDGTSANFVPTSALKAGTYTANAAVTDKSGNSASTKWSFTVEFDTVPPSVTVVSPQAEARVIERKPMISAIYTDSLSGVDETSVKFWLDGTPAVNPKVSATQVSFMPQTELAYGLHTVKLEVSDLATPKVNTAVQEWTFRVEDPRVKILDARNFPNPFLDKTTIVFTLTRQAKVTIKIYDMTMRLVRTLVQDEFREAEENVKYPWDGETDAGEVLARGVYFCQIIIHSELNPESAVLKLALTR